MAGRPPKPLEFKRQDGNTRKIAKAAFEAQLEAIIQSSPGEPEFPPEMLEHEDDEENVARYKRDFARRWRRACEDLARDQILYTGHGAIISTFVKAQIQSDRAFFTDDWRAFDAASKQVMQISSLIGLNASGAAKIPRPAEKKMDGIESALCG